MLGRYRSIAANSLAGLSSEVRRNSLGTRAGDAFEWWANDESGYWCELVQGDLKYACLIYDCRGFVDTITAHGSWRVSTTSRGVQPGFVVCEAGTRDIAVVVRLKGLFGVGHKASVEFVGKQQLLWEPKDVIGIAYHFRNEAGEELMIQRQPLIRRQRCEQGSVRYKCADAELKPQAAALQDSDQMLLLIIAQCLQPGPRSQGSIVFP